MPRKRPPARRPISPISPIGPTRSKRLIRDLVAAEHDLIELGQLHRLTPDDLARWIADPTNQQTLAGLCRLADLQTQILLSRYRLLAASRLIRLATGDEGDGEEKSGGSSGGSCGRGSDVARRACVDLLKLDLKRADLTGASVPRASTRDGDESPLGVDPMDPHGPDVQSLRQWFYGTQPGNPAQDEPGSPADRPPPTPPARS